MGNLLFSPSGRINSGEFIKGAVLLIVLGILLSVPGILEMGDGLETVAMLLSFLLIVPWIFIWIKRYHDAGKPGAMCLVPIFIYIIGFIVMVIFLMGDIIALMFSEAAMSDPESIEAEVEALTKEMTMPVAIGSTVWSLIIAFGFNAMIKHQPEENQFGHPG